MPTAVIERGGRLALMLLDLAMVKKICPRCYTYDKNVEHPGSARLFSNSAAGGCHELKSARV